MVIRPHLALVLWCGETSYGELPFDGILWGLWRMVIFWEWGHQLDGEMQLSIFTFTCGSREIRPRRTFQITVWVHQVYSMEDKLSIKSPDTCWGGGVPITRGPTYGLQYGHYYFLRVQFLYSPDKLSSRTSAWFLSISHNFGDITMMSPC